jgi:hypothetical protein
LTGGDGDRRGRYQPPGPVCLVGAELGRAFHGQRRSGRAATVLRLGGGGLQRGSHLLIRLQCRCGQVPGPPVWLVVQRLGELAVRCGALREGRGVVDGGPDEGMGEPHAGPVDRDQALPLGRHEGQRIWPATVADCCAQVGAVGHGGQQQRGLRLLGQGGEPRGDNGAEPVSQRQRLGGPAAAGGGILGDHLSQLDQRHGITLRLGEYLRPGSSAGRVRLRVQQPAGVSR